jgi:N-acetylglucosaminyl-diphospho-decaprenol L-rhamnosyltransferase
MGIPAMNRMLKPMKTCALIFINWNSPDLTIQAIASAKNSTDSPETLRFIVVDNGSSDDSVARIGGECPEAEIVEMGGNRGFAAAVNAGLERTQEAYAFICNSDILFHENAIEGLVEAVESDSAAALACPKLLREDGSLQAAAVPEPSIFWELVNRSLPRRFLTLDSAEPTVVPTVVGPCMALHRERLKSVGYFDDRFFFFFEETDFCRRINRAGYHCLYAPAAEVVHFQGESANKRPIRARIQFFESRYIYFRKHTGILGVWLLATGLFVKLALNTALYGVLSVGSRRFRDKFAVSRRILAWHLRGCPSGWGLQ